MSNSNVETNINNFKKFSYFLKGPAIVTVRQAIGRVYQESRRQGDDNPRGFAFQRSWLEK